MKIIIALAFISGLAAQVSLAQPSAPSAITIVTAPDAGVRETLAAREVMRYLYLRTGLVAPISHQEPGTDCILIAAKGRALLSGASIDQRTRDDIGALKAQEYIVRTVPSRGADHRGMVLVAGGDDTGALYGAYRLVEHLGVRFYLHGDTIPDQRIPWTLPSIDETGRPYFAIRGIQPFHDFPDGPDWWTRDDYLACVAQLPKLRMNFIGLHTYPEGSPNAEPAVWIGLPQDVLPNGDVAFSYPASWANTARQVWGYSPMKTKDFCAGASQLFTADTYCTEVMDGMTPAPAKPGQCNELFDRTGRMFSDVFAEAKALGVQTCIGTETPLRVPAAVRRHIQAIGKNPDDPAVTEELYEGIFRRISLASPVDYYWLWTPEGWTWGNNTPAQYQNTLRDIGAARTALSKLGSPIKFATCGWVLGPANDRAALDRELPTNVPMSAINRTVGHTSLDQAFFTIQDRPKWAIPWLENDGVLTGPEPWAGRMRYDAVDARRAGCTGLLGIHWRTKAVAVNVAALADAAWDQSWAPVPANKAGAAKPAPGKDRSMPVEDLYEDFARANFGENLAVPAGRILAGVDGTKMPEACAWLAGPGAVINNPSPWEQTRKRYQFVDELAALRPQVAGAGNLTRFDYWLNTYRCLSVMNEAGCARGALDRLVKTMSTGQDPGLRKNRAQEALAARIHLARLWEKMMTFQIAATDTPGELGTIANLEMHSRTALHFVTADDDKIAKSLGKPLPEEAQLSMTYSGEPRIIVPTVRTQAAPGEKLKIKVILIGKQPDHWRDAALYCRALGKGDYKRLPLQPVGRGVFEVTLPPAASDDLAMEYYIQAAYGQERRVFPVTAPAIDQTVVIAPVTQP